MCLKSSTAPGIEACVCTREYGREKEGCWIGPVVVQRLHFLCSQFTHFVVNSIRLWSPHSWHFHMSDMTVKKVGFSGGCGTKFLDGGNG